MKPSFSVDLMGLTLESFTEMIVQKNDAVSGGTFTDIFTGAPQATFVDQTTLPAARGIRRYRVILKSPDGLWVTGPEFPVVYRDDWYVLDSNMDRNLSAIGQFVDRGNEVLGLLTPPAGLPLPDQTLLTDAKWAELVLAPPGNSGAVPSTSNTTRTLDLQTLLYRGRIIRFGKTMQPTFISGNIGGEVSGAWGQNFYNYLQGNPAAAAFTVDGVIWRLKMMSASMFRDFGYSLVSGSVSVPMAVNLGEARFTGRYYVGDDVTPGETICMYTDNYLAPLSASMRGFTGAGNAHFVYIYFEYAGPA